MLTRAPRRAWAIGRGESPDLAAEDSLSDNSRGVRATSANGIEKHWSASTDVIRRPKAHPGEGDLFSSWLSPFQGSNDPLSTRHFSTLIGRRPEIHPDRVLRTVLGP